MSDVREILGGWQSDGIGFVRFELPDMHGISRSKTIPIAHAFDYAERGLNMYGGASVLDTRSDVVGGTLYHEEKGYGDQLLFPDPDSARQFCSPELEIRFTGNRLMRDPADATAFNKARYKWVKKKFGPTHIVAGGTAEETIVYQTGTLYGEWPDGTPFEGNRYVDRYVVRRGKIVRMEVWNDSAEWLLVRAGLAKP